jgi:hypothetical protein
MLISVSTLRAGENGFTDFLFSLQPYRYLQILNTSRLTAFGFAVTALWPLAYGNHRYLMRFIDRGLHRSASNHHPSCSFGRSSGHRLNSHRIRQRDHPLQWLLTACLLFSCRCLECYSQEPYLYVVPMDQAYHHHLNLLIFLPRALPLANAHCHFHHR